MLEEGEHGYLAARVASQVIKAYVEKQRRLPTKMAKTDGKAEVGAVWSAPDPDGDKETLHAGRFTVVADKKNSPTAPAAPGVN